MLKYGWNIWVHVYKTYLNEDSDITIEYIALF